MQNNIASSKSNLHQETDKSKNILDGFDFSKDEPKKFTDENIGKSVNSNVNKNIQEETKKI